jgi:hypothetical protein
MTTPFDAYKGFYSWAEKKLEPAQWLVTILLVAILAITAWALLTKDPVKRTLWALYMWLP